LEGTGYLKRPVIPVYATVNGNMYFVETTGSGERDRLITHLRKHGISAVFHYPPLHSSPYFKPLHDGRELPNTDHFSASILRLPFFYALKQSQIRRIVDTISHFYK
jgi:dTDP-4-amino-4,6-dideoxygalactose transaminase